MTDMVDFADSAYLLRGSALHQEVYALLQDLRIMEVLAAYHPVLAGTVPLGIQVAGSDLDIICEVHDHGRFTAEARSYFGDREGFCYITRIVHGVSRTKINFAAGSWPVELFGQPRPTLQQNGYLHMLAEQRILNVLGAGFREAVIEMKRGGMKTEPAFARLLHLEGDPYEALLQLGGLTPEELNSVCTKAYPYIE